MQGKQKLFLPYHQKTILETVLEQLGPSHCSEVIVVASPLTYDQISAMPTACLPAGRGITLISNADHKQGMTTTIQCGVRTASSDTSGYMICLGDMPRITTEEYNHLITKFSDGFNTDPKAILLPFYQGQKGNPVIFSSVYRDDILKHREMEGCKAIVQANSSHLIKVEMEKDHVLVDVDTPGDYEGLL